MSLVPAGRISLYRAFNVVFGKVGRIPSPNVVVELVTRTQLSQTDRASAAHTIR